MPYLDVFIRTPDMYEGVVESAHFPDTDQLGKNVREAVFNSFPEATDYSFKEISSNEVAQRELNARLGRYVRIALDFATYHSQMNNTKGY